jgi:predicted DNA-binding transcriptional regulator AlpA
MDNSDERWLSRRELAERYGLPVKTLAQWASKGTGPRYARMGRHVRYRLSDVIGWEAGRFDEKVRDQADPGPSPNHSRGETADTASRDANSSSPESSR